MKLKKIVEKNKMQFRFFIATGDSFYDTGK